MQRHELFGKGDTVGRFGLGELQHTLERVSVKYRSTTTPTSMCRCWGECSIGGCRGYEAVGYTIILLASAIPG
jgi:hypothetical protein